MLLIYNELRNHLIMYFYDERNHLRVWYSDLDFETFSTFPTLMLAKYDYQNSKEYTIIHEEL